MISVRPAKMQAMEHMHSRETDDLPGESGSLLNAKKPISGAGKNIPKCTTLSRGMPSRLFWMSGKSLKLPKHRYATPAM